MHGALIGGVLLWALAIALVDLRLRKIPNLLTLPACLVGLAWMALSGHCMTGEDWDSGLWAGAFGLVVTVPAYALRKLGAGDAKYLLAIGILSGWPVTRDTFVIAAALGVAVTAGWWYLQHNPWAGRLLRPFAPAFKALTAERAGKSSDQSCLPFGTLLSIGFCAALLNR